MTSKPWQVVPILLYGRKKQALRNGRPMKPAKDLNQFRAKTPTTTKDELKLVCEKIADVDALWRICDACESPTLKRAA